MRGAIFGLIAATCGAWGSAPAAAEPIEWSAAGEVAVVSTYIWRGVNFHDDRLEPAVQPFVHGRAAGLGPGDLTLGVFASRPFAEQAATSTEIDPYAIYAIDTGGVTVGARYWVFLVPAADPVDTGHLFDLTGRYAISGALSAELGVSVDPIRADSGYYYAAAAAEHAPGQAVTLVATVSAAVSHSAADDFGLHDITAVAGCAYALTDTAYARVGGQLAYGARMPDGRRWLPALTVAAGYTWSP